MRSEEASRRMAANEKCHGQRDSACGTKDTTGVTGGVPKGHHAPLTSVKIDQGVKILVCEQ